MPEKHITILLSPTEHSLLAILPKSFPDFTYRISSLCEANGADLIIPTSKGLAGYQRKTLPDLKSSLIDGRLFKELSQLRTSPIIAYPFILIEHTPRQVTIDGSFLDVDLPIKNYHSLLTKFQILNIHYLHSPNHIGTILAAINSSTYISSTHSSELRRPTAPKNAWGVATNSAFLSYLLQSFPNVGPKLAEAIVKAFTTTLPLIWTCTQKDFLAIPGIGPALAEKLYSFFSPSALTIETE